MSHARPAPFHLHRGNTGRSGLVDWDPHCETTTIDVSVARGATLIHRGIAPPPNVIKLDVEGCEDRVLVGMGEFLRSTSLRAVIFEDGTDDSTPAKHHLQNAGFSIHRLERKEPTHHGLDNYLARRPTETSPVRPPQKRSQ